MDFRLKADFKPTGDQPEAIAQLVHELKEDVPFQTLLGVTGSGKTFTVANVIQEVQRPTLILSHNKTLAAQLYGEFKQFFPDNAVEYFVSYYDYYQPEAYLPTSDTYIEKDLSINAEIEKLRLSATSALLSGRRDVVVISSVSCIYGMGNPDDFGKNVIDVAVNMEISRTKFLHRLVESLYSRAQEEFNRGQFRVTGDTVDIFLAYADHLLRVHFWGDEIEALETIDPETGNILETFETFKIYPANIFVTTPETLQLALGEIQEDMEKQVARFHELRQHDEAKRLEERVSYDIEMMKELGYCSGIENYSRYFDRRPPGSRPFCLIDYFPDDFLMVIDESHVTIPQIRAMYGGDRSRKTNLVEYGFRLAAAIDNRPLQFPEFESLLNQTLFVSATPADFELEKSEGVVVEQVIRPTGLLDPIIEVRPAVNQVDDLLDEIQQTIDKKERVLVTTLTKRMAEELQKYLENLGISSAYIHSDVDTLDRVEILKNLRLGTFDVLVGVNLLREGLDLPEVSLIAIMDADKEGFLRSHRSLVQTVGRAARNVNGKAIMYADHVTDSMEKTIQETSRRRAKQIAYNEEHGLTPQALNKTIESVIDKADSQEENARPYDTQSPQQQVAADPVLQYMSIPQLEKALKNTKRKMEKAAKEMDFMEAAKWRDEMFALQALVQQKKG